MTIGPQKRGMLHHGVREKKSTKSDLNIRGDSGRADSMEPPNPVTRSQISDFRALWGDRPATLDKLFV